MTGVHAACCFGAPPLPGLKVLHDQMDRRGCFGRPWKPYPRIWMRTGPSCCEQPLLTRSLGLARHLRLRADGHSGAAGLHDGGHGAVRCLRNNAA